MSLQVVGLYRHSQVTASIGSLSREEGASKSLRNQSSGWSLAMLSLHKGVVAGDENRMC